MMKKIMMYLQEVGLFVSIVGGCVIFGTIVLNMNAFMGTVQDLIWGVPTVSIPLGQKDSNIRLGSIQKITKEIQKHQAADDMIKPGYHRDIESYLRRQFKNIKLSFNLLPPDNYLIIPEIGVQVRLVDTHMVSSTVLEQGDFESYLQQGVVKYPATADPGSIGNALLFGHTSLEPWKLAKNKYGTIFRNIPKLKEGSQFSVIRNGEQYNYDVVKKTIKNPKDVKNFYAQYTQDNSYVSLMGCYPIGSDAQRMIVVGELKNKEPTKTQSNELVAYHR